MIRIPGFITEDDVNYYKVMSDDFIKNLIEGNRKLRGFPDGDIDELLKQFREDNFTEYRRKNTWKCRFTNVLNNDGTIKHYRTGKASFNFINKWNQESESCEYKIIFDDNKKILWIGENDKFFYISIDDKIYGIKYEHKILKIFPNISSSDEYFNEKQEEKNDYLIKKYYMNTGTYKYTHINNVQKTFIEDKTGICISLDDYFEKGFFYKGFKWDINWDKYYGYNYITMLTDIAVKKGLFCLNIINITYPFYGYLLLDLEKLEITEAKKYSIEQMEMHLC